MTSIRSLCAWLILLGAVCRTLRADPTPGPDAPPPPGTTPPPPARLTLDSAVVYALQNSPELRAIRQRHGIAAADLVIARTYPYNPVLEARVRAAWGADVVNPVDNEYILLFQLELRGQRWYRRQAASAALSRTDWEIVAQETALAVRVIRAYRAVLYRQAKVQLQEEAIRLSEQIASLVPRLLGGGKVRPADLILARTEVGAVRGQLFTARAALTAAQNELRRSMGVVGPMPAIDGALERPPVPPEGPALEEDALRLRPDLRARRSGVAEAQARVGLTVADRYGNLTIGPVVQYDQTADKFVGVQAAFPLPCFNTRRGEILMRQADLGRLILELHQAEVSTRQEVEASLARLATARAGLDAYERDILPALRTGLEGVERLFRAGEPGIDVLRVLDLRRKLIAARDGYLDLLFEAAQAQADLAAAVGDPAVGVGPSPAATLLPPTCHPTTLPKAHP